ncbi:hypothetical protein VDM83_000941 [Campylobacter coli]|nr:hypothetical protein [Campylobacter coli]
MTEEKLLKSLADGVLKINESSIDVAVLENGVRIITHSGVFRALGREPRGNARLDQIPAFMDAKNLQPLISSELKTQISRISYLDKNSKVKEGYNADILPLVADLYLKAREEGILTQAQIETAKKAEILIRSLARLGITALVDEATGYQYERERDELQIYKVIGIMQTSDNMKQMWENFKKIKLREQDEDIEFDEKGRLKEK